MGGSLLGLTIVHLSAWSCCFGTRRGERFWEPGEGLEGMGWHWG